MQIINFITKHIKDNKSKVPASENRKVQSDSEILVSRQNPVSNRYSDLANFHYKQN